MSLLSITFEQVLAERAIDTRLVQSQAKEKRDQAADEIVKATGLSREDVITYLSRVASVEFCSRCGGAGGSSKWDHTGWTCFTCGGSGGIKHHDFSVEVAKAKSNPKAYASYVKRYITRQAKKTAENERRRAEFDRQEAQIQAQRQAEKDKRSSHFQRENVWFIEKLKPITWSNFVQSIVSSLETRELACDLSPKAISILADIVGKEAGRRNSKAYADARDEFEDQIEKQSDKAPKQPTSEHVRVSGSLLNITLDQVLAERTLYDADLPRNLVTKYGLMANSPTEMRRLIQRAMHTATPVDKPALKKAEKRIRDDAAGEPETDQNERTILGVTLKRRGSPDSFGVSVSKGNISRNVDHTFIYLNRGSVELSGHTVTWESGMLTKRGYDIHVSMIRDMIFGKLPKGSGVKFEDVDEAARKINRDKVYHVISGRVGGNIASVWSEPVSSVTQKTVSIIKRHFPQVTEIWTQ